MGLESHRKEREKGTLCVKQTPRSPIPMRAPHVTAIRRRTELLAVILFIQLYYILLYIELRESQTATITFSSMLQFTPDCTALFFRLNADWLLRYTCHSVATLLNADWQIRVSTFTLYEILSPCRVKAQRVCRRRQKETLRANLYSMFAIGAFYTYISRYIAYIRYIAQP